MPTPKVYYNVNIPDFAKDTVPSYSPKQAIATLVIREMRKRNSNVWWNGRQYKGLVGEKNMVEDILDLAEQNPDKYVSVAKNQPKPVEEPPIEGRKPKMQQLEFELPQHIVSCLDQGYDELYTYSLYGKGFRIKASNIEQFTKLQEKHLGCKADVRSLTLIPKASNRDEYFKSVATQLLDMAESDPNVIDLLKQADLEIDSLQSLDIEVVDPSVVDKPIILSSGMVIPFIRSTGNMEMMYEQFLCGMNAWFDSKTKADMNIDATQILASKISEAGSVADVLYADGLPKAAINIYLAEHSHPAITHKLADLNDHLQDCIISKFAVSEESKTLAVDFDGTIASYKPGQFPIIGEPEPDVVDVMQQLHKDGWNIIIYSCRSTQEGQTEAMSEWLNKNQIPYDSIWEGQGKPMATAYIDDLGIQYKGNWKDIYTQLKSKKQASLLCKKCNTTKLWFPENFNWQCQSCGDFSIIEKTAFCVYTLQPGDTVAYEVGNFKAKASLKNLVGVDIWKTSMNHLVNRNNLKLVIQESAKPIVKKESWLSDNFI